MEGANTRGGGGNGAFLPNTEGRVDVGCLGIRSGNNVPSSTMHSVSYLTPVETSNHCDWSKNGFVPQSSIDGYQIKGGLRMQLGVDILTGQDHNANIDICNPILPLILLSIKQYKRYLNKNSL